MKQYSNYTVKLPFCGFYESEASYMLENSNLTEVQFAAAYTQAFQSFLASQGLEVSLTFEELECPEFYDNETDKIYCKISEQDLLALWDHTDKEELARTVVDKFERPTNPADHYPTKLSQQPWIKPIVDWDLTQLETLLQSVLVQHGVSGECEEILQLMDRSTNDKNIAYTPAYSAEVKKIGDN